MIDGKTTESDVVKYYIEVLYRTVKASKKYKKID